MSPARLREIADTLPGYVCGQIKFHADAWERDIAASADLRIEREAHAALLAATRAERDRLRATVDSIAEAVGAHTKGARFVEVGANPAVPTAP